MCLPTQDRAMSIAGIIGSAVPSAAAVEKIRAVPSPRHQRHYEAQLSDGSVLLLRLPLPLMVKLLRSERAASVSAEAAVLAWIGDLNDDYDDYDDENPDQRDAGGSSAGSGGPQGGNPQQAPGRHLVLGTRGSTDTARSRGAHPDVAPRDNVPFIPALVAHSPAHTLAGPEFNVVRPSRGSLLAGLTPPLMPSERAAVDFQNGRLLRRLSRMRSPSGKFGPALGVLGRRGPPPPKRIGVQGATGGGSGSARAWVPRGSGTWAAAFAALLEGVLRDGEDMHVTLPYSSIRQHFWRLEHLLGGVTNPCLVVVDAGEDDNMLVVRKTGLSSAGSSAKRLERNTSHRRKKSGSEKDAKGKSKDGKDKTRPGPSTPTQDGTAGEDSDSGIIYSSTNTDVDIVVTGMRDWSNCIFGDPLFATAFHRNPSDNLWSGFTSPAGGDPGPSPVEDEAHAETRLLLYECYHIVTRVVREFYRPSKDNSKRELAARKELNGVMARLERVPDGSLRRRRPSGEMSPAKRYKTDEEEDEGACSDDDDE